MPYRSQLQRMFDTDPAPDAITLPRDAGECPPHHFVIDSPNGQTSNGCCKKCGIGRDYRNWFEQYEYAGSVWKRSAAESL
ncbi:MAG: hypothetical protein LC118_05655 [Dehalococcoidia bacterium]|nr:hypothetical protein [Dehalococcoidia bacterium]